MSKPFTVRRDPADELSDSVATHIDWNGREIAYMVCRDDADDEQFARMLVEAANNYLAMCNAVKDLIFAVGQLPADKTIADDELRKAYSAVSQFVREDWEKRDPSEALVVCTNSVSSSTQTSDVSKPSTSAHESGGPHVKAD